MNCAHRRNRTQQDPTKNNNVVLAHNCRPTTYSDEWTHTNLIVIDTRRISPMKMASIIKRKHLSRACVEYYSAFAGQCFVFLSVLWAACNRHQFVSTKCVRTVAPGDTLFFVWLSPPIDKLPVAMQTFFFLASDNNQNVFLQGEDEKKKHKILIGFHEYL